jgi:5-(carboxyamino)imidazole ribonucleotide synthase
MDMKLGFIGGGQLSRMTYEALLPLNVQGVVIDPNPNCPASQVGAEQIVAQLNDEDAVLQLAERVDCITWDVEHPDTRAAATLITPVYPYPETLAVIQDKLAQKNLLREHGIPVADFAPVSGQRELEGIFSRFGKVIVKARFGGYDGRGNMNLYKPDWQSVVGTFGEEESKRVYAERVIDFEKELSVIVAKTQRGDMVPYPVAETIHEDNICHMVLSPPEQVDPKILVAARELACDTVQLLGGASIYAMEMFLTKAGDLMINEIAPRPHNSGHHTIEAHATSQFEQHGRAVLGWPLGSIARRAPAAVMVNILGRRDGPVDTRGIEDVLAMPDVHLHLYGKAPTKRKRKMGHVTALAATLGEAKALALRAREAISI